MNKKETEILTFLCRLLIIILFKKQNKIDKISQECYHFAVSPSVCADIHLITVKTL